MSEQFEPLITEFLRVQYGACPGAYASVWTKQTRETHFFRLPDDADALAEHVWRNAASQDLYLMLGLQREALDKSKRGATSSVVAVPGFFADIDFRSAKDTNKAYPADAQQALEILRSFPFEPTWVLSTGGGLHAHWLFDELRHTDTPEELANAKKVSARFQRALQLHFRKHGTEIDSVGDLARNYRIPGTFNHKHGEPEPVRMLAWKPATRISIDDVLKWLDQSEPAPKSRAKRAKGQNLDHERIRSECAWYGLVTGERAASCDEPNWYAAASVTALCKGGDQIFHEYSARHSGYSVDEATKKLARARAEAGPRTCDNIETGLGFSGCESCPHKGLITSPAQLGRRLEYQPGETGPVPLGYTRNGSFALLDRGMSVILLASAQQLLSAQYLQGLAPGSYWAEQFPPTGKTRFDFVAAGEALIAACRAGGAFLPHRVRGRGIWREGERVIVNLGGEIPSDTKYHYLCFEPIRLDAEGEIDAQRLLDLLNLFKWRHSKNSVLLLGWLAIAPICGVLTWRPHGFLYGPSRSGKTTLHTLAAHLLSPLVISADGGSTEAGIRQTIGPDSLPVIIDEFESDQNAGRMAQIVKLARSASSAENPMLRGTPEGKAMQFSLCTTFFFSGINPRAMSAADDSRILQFELLMHDNDRDVAKRIREEEAYFRALGPVWCATMAKLALKIPASVDVLLEELPGADRRHRQNMATLLAGAFVALNRREPTRAEAQSLISEVTSVIELHAQPLERDDAAECFQKLLSHEVERYPLAHWIAVALKGEEIGNEKVLEDSRRIVRNYDLVLHRGNEFEGLMIRNGSPNLEKVFERTQWSGGAWVKALKKLQGAFTPDNPFYFPNAGKSRCTGIPFSYVPEPYPVPEQPERSGDFFGPVKF